MKTQTVSITHKLVLLLLCLVIPINILSVWSAYIMISDASSSIISSLHSTLASYTRKLDERISNSNYLLYDVLQNNEDAIAILNADNETDYKISRQKLFVKLRDTLSVANAADIMFFQAGTRKDNVLIIPSNTSAIPADLIKKYLEDTDINNNDGKWHLAVINNTSYAVKFFNGNGYYYGAIIEIDRLVSDIGNFIEYKDFRLAIFDASKDQESNYTYIRENCSNIKLTFQLSINHSDIIVTISAWKWIFVLLLLLSVALIPLLYHYLRKLVVNPLTTLNDAHYQLKMGNQEYRIADTAVTRDFQTAYISFNNMAESIQHLTLETINKELAYKQMLLTNLQLQIRPHFLLNAFNMVYTLIQTQKCQAAQKMILYLSEYFRYLFQYNEELELFSKEYNLITKYLEVAKIQYPDAFTFVSQIDPEIYMVRLPPLLLHNFIENIVSHALVPDRIIHIVFNGFYDNGIVTFQIADDGCGMTPEDTAQINNGSYTNIHSGKHLGIRNSITRLRFFYEDKASVSVESAPDEGTIFTITFPYNLEISDNKNGGCNETVNS